MNHQFALGPDVLREWIIVFLQPIGIHQASDAIVWRGTYCGKESVLFRGHAA